ncbi:hypothetical protein E8E12_003097 [Didymella heteroderae]|uniref:Uncharacterized protein n=1 Tax=Didymella heteroderae TaxID=1769908 RepID=A0A9P4WGJ0_9PLEO|nr:hypothetical protein E8E12_003097 [Didymella heteroderae]
MHPSPVSPASPADHLLTMLSALRPSTSCRPARYHYTPDAAYHSLRLTVDLHHLTDKAAAKKGHKLRVAGLAASHSDDERRHRWRLPSTTTRNTKRGRRWTQE